MLTTGFNLFQKFLERADANKSSDISLAEFIHYVKEHEKNLRLGFSHIDKNQDGKVIIIKIVVDIALF